jgi:hypothetical protein
MNCPQNLIVDGLSSNKFNLDFNFFYNLNYTPIAKINEETMTLFILSILNDIIDNIGDTFTIIININKNAYSDAIYTGIMEITLPNIEWIIDFSHKISTLLNNIDKNIVTITNSKLSIINNKWICNNDLPNFTFKLIAKNGTYIEKKRTIIKSEIKTSETPGFGYGHQYKFFNPKTIDF